LARRFPRTTGRRRGGGGLAMAEAANDKVAEGASRQVRPDRLAPRPPRGRVLGGTCWAVRPTQVRHDGERDWGPNAGWPASSDLNTTWGRRACFEIAFQGSRTTRGLLLLELDGTWRAGCYLVAEEEQGENRRVDAHRGSPAAARSRPFRRALLCRSTARGGPGGRLFGRRRRARTSATFASTGTAQRARRS